MRGRFRPAMLGVVVGLALCAAFADATHLPCQAASSLPAIQHINLRSAPDGAKNAPHLAQNQPQWLSVGQRCRLRSSAILPPLNRVAASQLRMASRFLRRGPASGVAANTAMLVTDVNSIRPFSPPLVFVRWIHAIGWRSLHQRLLLSVIALVLSNHDDRSLLAYDLSRRRLSLLEAATAWRQRPQAPAPRGQATVRCPADCLRPRQESDPA